MKAVRMREPARQNSAEEPSLTSSGENDPQSQIVGDNEIEGRLSAHRDIVTKLLSLLASDAAYQAILFEWLDERIRVQDHQEDPGAVILEAFAEQQARADEFKLISDDVRRLVEFYGENTPSPKR